MPTGRVSACWPWNSEARIDMGKYPDLQPAQAAPAEAGAQPVRAQQDLAPDFEDSVGGLFAATQPLPDLLQTDVPAPRSLFAPRGLFRS